MITCLIQCVAYIEATIDFGEDENIEEDLVDEGSILRLD